MKLSNREKILLLILLVAALSGAFYFFVGKPQFEKIAALEKSKADYSAKVQALSSQISPKNPIYAESKVYETKVKDRTAIYYPNITQEKIITILEDQFKNAEFQPSNINYADLGAALPTFETTVKESEKDLLRELANKFSNYKPIQEVNAKQFEAENKLLSATLGSVDRLGVTLAYKTSYESLSLFIGQLEQSRRRIIIDNITCMRNEEDLLVGTMEVSFYAIPKLLAQDADYDEWTYNNKYGKYNPFLPFGGYVDATKVNSTEVKKSESADFFMSLKPLSSDVPSFMIGKKGKQNQKTYLYADNETNETVELQFLEQNGKFYYKYRTEGESYPADYKTAIEFHPGTKDITVEVLSSKRGDAKDTSGANIKVINKTKRKVLVNVMFDDKDNHRANFVEKVGDVVISSTMEE